MTSWGSAALKDLVTDAKSGFACGEDSADGVFQFRMNNVAADGTLDYRKKRRVPKDIRGLDRALLEPGDVLFNATNSPELVGKSAFFPGHDEPAAFSNHFLRLRTNPATLDGRYLTRWMSVQFQRGVFRGMCRQWVNQATVSREALLAMTVPLPSLSQQRRIADILDRADALRAKRRAALALLDTLPQSICVNMFGDPMASSNRWPRVRFNSLGSLDRGVSKHRPRNAPELLGGRYPLIQTGDVANSGGYIRQFGSTYSEVGLKQSRMWPAGTLRITIAANIAKTGILTFDACFPDSVVGFCAHAETVEYVRAWLGFMQESLENAAPESAQKNINLNLLRNLELPLPGSDLRMAFAKRVAAVESLKAAHRASLAAMDALFASLQHRAFRGEL